MRARRRGVAGKHPIVVMEGSAARLELVGWPRLAGPPGMDRCRIPKPAARARGVTPYGAAPAHRPTRNPLTDAGLTIGLVDFFLILLSLTTLTWVKNGLFAEDFAFFHAFSSLPGHGLTKVYFGWLAVTGFILTTAVAVIAKLNTPWAGLMRALGAFLGFTLAALTFGALAVGNPVSDVFTYARFGFWAAIVGFICIGAAAVL